MIMKNKKFCYIKKYGSYYRDNYCGYTDFECFAGVYPMEEAKKHAKGTIEFELIPINTIEHNENLEQMIKSMQKRLIY